MANHKSAIKRHRQNLKKRASNRFAKATIRTKVKAALAALESNDKDSAKALAKQATSLLDKAVIHGVIHKNAAKRRVSRLNKKMAV